MTEFKVDPDVLSEILHSGVKGMKWGVRKEDVTAHNKITDQLVSSIKSAKTEDDVEWVLNGARANGLIEGNLKIENVSPSVDGKKLSYELKAYRLTEGAANTHSGDGIKVEYITKEVPRDPGTVPVGRALAKRVAIDSKAQIKELNASYLDGKPPAEGTWKSSKYQSKVENIILNNLNQAHAQMTTGLVSKLNSSKQANRYGIGTRLFLDSKNREAAAKYGFKMTPQQQKLVSDRSKDAVVNSIVRVGWRFTALHLIAPMLHAATDAPDVDLSDIYFDVLLNDAGLVVDVIAGSHKEDTAEEVAQHMDNEDYGATWQDYLAHHGIKGMKWGRRRPDGSDGTVSGGLKGANKPTEGGPDHNGDGSSDRLSADAERALHTLSKPQSEMSTRELKEAVERAKQVEQYNKMFGGEGPKGGDPKIQAQIDRLRQQKELADLKAQTAPPSRVDTLVKRSAQGFAAFQTLDAASGGALSNHLKTKLGMTEKPSAHDELKARSDILKLKSEVLKSDNDITDQTTRGIESAAALSKARESAAAALAAKAPPPSTLVGIGPEKVSASGFPSFVGAQRSVASHLITGSDGRVRPKPGFGWDGYPLESQTKTASKLLDPFVKPDGSLGYH